MKPDREDVEQPQASEPGAVLLAFLGATAPPGKMMLRSSDRKGGDGKAGDGKAGDGKAGDGKADDGKAGGRSILAAAWRGRGQARPWPTLCLGAVALCKEAMQQGTNLGSTGWLPGVKLAVAALE